MSWKQCEHCSCEQQIRREGVLSKLMLCLSCYEDEIVELKNRSMPFHKKMGKVVVVVTIEEINNDLEDGVVKKYLAGLSNLNNEIENWY